MVFGEFMSGSNFDDSGARRDGEPWGRRCVEVGGNGRKKVEKVPQLGPRCRLVSFFFFGWEGKPLLKSATEKKAGTLVLTSLLEDLGVHKAEI